jgi:hypothetical protein
MHCGHVCVLRAKRCVILYSAVILVATGAHVHRISSVSTRTRSFDSMYITQLSHGLQRGCATTVSATDTEVAWQDVLSSGVADTCLRPRLCAFQQSRPSLSLTVGTTLARVNARIILYVTSVAQPREGVSDTARVCPPSGQCENSVGFHTWETLPSVLIQNCF